MYLNFYSEHPMSLKSLYLSLIFLDLKRIHSESHYLLQVQIQLYWCFRWREYPHDILIEAWSKTSQVTRETLLSDTRNNQDTNAPLMFITIYNSANPNFRELVSKHWSYLGGCSANRELGRQEIVITYRKPPSLEGMLIRAKIPQPKSITHKGCTRPNTCKYCIRTSKSGKVTNLNNTTTYNTITKGTCQNNNLIYCLECNWCHIKYVGQTNKQNH